MDQRPTVLEDCLHDRLPAIPYWPVTRATVLPSCPTRRQASRRARSVSDAPPRPDVLTGLRPVRRGQSGSMYGHTRLIHIRITGRHLPVDPVRRCGGDHATEPPPRRPGSRSPARLSRWRTRSRRHALTRSAAQTRKAPKAPITGRLKIASGHRYHAQSRGASFESSDEGVGAELPGDSTGCRNTGVLTPRLEGPC